MRVGLIGAGFIARPHLQALKLLRSVWGPELPEPELVAVCDVDARLADAARVRYGFAGSTSRWQDVTRHRDVDAVFVLTPNATHARIALDALAHGKHVLCEKPLADRVEAARELHAAARAAGVTTQVAFAYRTWPAIQLAAELVRAGEIGTVLDFRARFLHDYALDPTHPHSWRFDRAQAGAGSLGDLGSHLIDLARVFAGEVATVRARTRTLIARRPVGGGDAPVDVDDAADLWLAFESGAQGALRTSWIAAGHQTDLALEVQGDRGSVRFSWERPNHVEIASSAGPEGTDAWRSIAVGPGHPGTIWPVPGVGLGWADAFLVAAHGFVTAAAAGRPAAPDFEDGLRAAQVVDAALRSGAEGECVPVERHHVAAQSSAAGNVTPPIASSPPRAADLSAASQHSAHR